MPQQNTNKGAWVPWTEAEDLVRLSLPDAQWRVFLAVLFTSRRYGGRPARLQVKDIATLTGLGLRTTERALAKLLERGLLRRHGRYGEILPTGSSKSSQRKPRVGTANRVDSCNKSPEPGTANRVDSCNKSHEPGTANRVDSCNKSPEPGTDNRVAVPGGTNPVARTANMVAVPGGTNPEARTANIVAGRNRQHGGGSPTSIYVLINKQGSKSPPFTAKQLVVINDVFAEASGLLGHDVAELTLPQEHARKLGMANLAPTYGEALAQISSSCDRSRTRDFVKAVLALRHDERVQGIELPAPETTTAAANRKSSLEQETQNETKT